MCRLWCDRCDGFPALLSKLYFFSAAIRFPLVVLNWLDIDVVEFRLHMFIQFQIMTQGSLLSFLELVWMWIVFPSSCSPWSSSVREVVVLWRRCNNFPGD